MECKHIFETKKFRERCRHCGVSYAHTILPTVYDKHGKPVESEDNYTCEWCAMTYPKGTYPYKKLLLRDEVHIICKDCFDHFTDI